jgi:hypothetical protein
VSRRERLAVRGMYVVAPTPESSWCPPAQRAAAPAPRWRLRLPGAAMHASLAGIGVRAAARPGARRCVMAAGS